MSQQLLNPLEIVEITGEKQRSIYNAMRDGTFPAIWLGPRRPRCPCDVLERFLRGDPVAKHYFKGKPNNDQENENAESAEPAY